MGTLEQVTVARMGRQTVARIVLALGLVVLGLYILQGFLRALLWAPILYIAVGSFYRRALRRFPPGRHNILMPLLFTVATTLLFVVPFVLILMQVGQEARFVADWIAQTRTHGAPMPEFMAHLPVFQEQATTWWNENLTDPHGARLLLGRLDRGDLMTIGREFGSQVARRSILFGFTVMTLFFLFRDGECLKEQMLVGSRKLFGPHGEPVARQVIASVHGTVDGLVLVGMGVGLVLGIGYAVAGAPHPALLGAATAIAAVIPLGAPIVLALAAVLVLAAGSTVGAIVLFVAGMVVIFVADHFIRPALIGGATKLPFIWVLLGILGGVETFGLLGLFLGPAVMAALILLWRQWTVDAKVVVAE